MTDPCKTKCKTVSTIDKAACCGCPERYEYEKEMRMPKENKPIATMEELNKAIDKRLNEILFSGRAEGSIYTLKWIIDRCERRIKEIENARDKRYDSEEVMDEE